MTETPIFYDATPERVVTDGVLAYNNEYRYLAERLALVRRERRAIASRDGQLAAQEDRLAARLAAMDAGREEG